MANGSRDALPAVESSLSGTVMNRARELIAAIYLQLLALLRPMVDFRARARGFLGH